MEERIATLEQEVAALKERNARVEADKAWETSATRAISVLVLTYLIASLAFFTMGDLNPLRSALIPTLGFFLSIQSLPVVRRIWRDLKAPKGSVK